MAAQERLDEQGMNDDEWEKENGDEDEEEGDSEPKFTGLSEYEKRQERNKAELAVLLAGLEERYSMPGPKLRSQR